MWKKANARYVRSSTGGGRWQVYSALPDRWTVSYRELTFNIKTMGFKHTGLFPEQAANWDVIAGIIKGACRPVSVLNLFAYTGGATVSALAAGASVTHVDASKGMTQWAKENAESSGVRDRSVRWLVDDCIKFVEREIRRGNSYDVIIMDPPSYGRGPGGEVWQLENEVYSLVEKCSSLLTSDSLAFMLNSYTTGLGCGVTEYILSSLIKPAFGGSVTSYELGLPCSASGLCLPCGSTALWRK